MSSLYENNVLHSANDQRTYAGANLSEIAFPLGGIGTGTIGLGGRGNLRDFEIFNHPDKGNQIPFTGFALWAQAPGQAPVAKILEGKIPPPYRAGGGEPLTQFAGLPRFANATFRGQYPMGTLSLDDPHMPVRATLEAWNPFISLNVGDSALPVAIFEWTFHNDGDAPIEISLASSLQNPLAAPGVQNTRDDGARNQTRESGGVHGVVLDNPSTPAGDAKNGTLALSTIWPHTDLVANWYHNHWFDKQHLFWDSFAATGQAPTLPPGEAETGGENIATLVLHATVPARGSVTLPLAISWHFPRADNPWRGGDESLPAVLETYAGAHFEDAWTVGEYVFKHLERLRRETNLWRDTIFAGTLPGYVLEAITSQASIMRANTCFLLADGSFFGWEGTWDKVGSCHGSCTHVWNYEQAVAFLFPQLERTMRRTEFLHNTRPSGNMAFRTYLPPGAKLFDFKPCVDGQMGTIVQVYRDWQLSGDDAFLKELWPRVKLALEYAWSMTPDKMEAGGINYHDHGRPAMASIDSLWDPNKDGLIEGEQHNTYDIEFYGPNTMCTAMYLGALRACELIARHLGEPAKADEYRAIRESGRKRVDAELWNGEFYIQKVDVIPEVTVAEKLISPNSPGLGAAGGARSGNALIPKYQYGSGCLSDQLLGQWAAHVAGLGYLLDAEHVRTALLSIFRHNFRQQMAAHHNVQRTYALNDEPGLLVCSWPLGDRPLIPMAYCDEVFTGIEYQVAAHLIYEGWVDEGLTLVKAVSERYAGYNRNPWNQIECGYHYARAMASWSVKLALDGFTFSMPEGRLGFAPKINAADYNTFWSTGTGWGSYCQNPAAGTFQLEVLYGTLSLRRLDLADLPAGDVAVRAPRGPVAATREGNAVLFSEPVALAAGESLTVTAV